MNHVGSRDVSVPYIDIDAVFVPEELSISFFDALMLQFSNFFLVLFPFPGNSHYPNMVTSAGSPQTPTRQRGAERRRQPALPRPRCPRPVPVQQLR